MFFCAFSVRALSHADCVSIAILVGQWARPRLLVASLWKLSVCHRASGSICLIPWQLVDPQGEQVKLI